MSAAEIGNSSTVEKKMTSVSRPSMCLQGRRDKASAFQCSLIGRYSVSYEYASKSQRCILAAANIVTALVGPMIVTSGRWSVTRMKARPCKYWFNFFMPEPILSS